MTQSIVQSAFEKHFPGFQQLSPFDPVRVLADAVASSWTELAKDQEQVFRRVLDALPDLLGYHARTARPHLAVMSFACVGETSSVLPRGTRLALQAEAMGIEAETLSDLHVAPLQLVRTQVDDDSHILELTGAPTGQLTLLFLPQASTSNDTSARVEVLTPFRGSIHDETAGLQKAGAITLKSVTPLSKERSFELRIRSPLGFRAGEFLVNSGTVSVFQRALWLEVGRLTGRPWEEISLPPGILRIPSELRLQYPTGESKLLEMGAGDLVLSSRQRPPYFYHSARHSLVFPDAHELCSGYLGEIPVHLSPCETIVEPLLFPTPTLAKLRSPVRGIEESGRLTRVLSAASPRETGEQLRKRFFSSLREHKRTWEAT